MSSEMGEMFSAIRQEQREHREKKRKLQIPALERLRKAGYDVHPFTEYQFRINNRLDIYPSRCRYHDIRNNQRGGYGGSDKLEKFVAEFFSRPEPKCATRDEFISSLREVGWSQADAENAWKERGGQ